MMSHFYLDARIFGDVDNRRVLCVVRAGANPAVTRRNSALSRRRSRPRPGLMFMQVQVNAGETAPTAVRERRRASLR